jgi:hypothetical protein
MFLSRKLIRWLWVTGISLAVVPVATVLHNLISMYAKVEEPVLFTVAIILAPVGAVAGITGMIVTLVRENRRPAP